MKSKEYIKSDVNGDYVKTYNADKGWEITLSFKGKTIKYAASNCTRTYWNNRKETVNAADEIFNMGIEKVYAEEHKRQFGI